MTGFSREGFQAFRTASPSRRATSDRLLPKSSIKYRFLIIVTGGQEGEYNGTGGALNAVHGSGKGFFPTRGVQILKK